MHKFEPCNFILHVKCTPTLCYNGSYSVLLQTKKQEKSMWILIAILLAALVVLGLATYLHRRKDTEPVEIKEVDSECCGQHAVCERDSLLSKGTQVVYYDDEELDALAGVSPINFTPEQLEQLEQVFYTLQEKDVAGWLRSLQARNIQLPIDLREEALLIVSERRNK